MKRQDGGRIDGDDHGLARTVVAVRIAVVVSIGALLVVGPPWMRPHAAAASAMLAAAMLYSLALLAFPRSEGRHTPHAWMVSAADGAFTCVLIGLTGGIDSPVSIVLLLVVMTSAARLSFRATLVVAAALGAGYLAVALLVTSPSAPTINPWVQVGWMAVLLGFVAVITAGLSALAEREQQSRIRALVEAEAEHAAAEEERDLRARLLQSYESQQDGLQVLVHEFRTPIASLEALMDAVTANQMSTADREASLQLAARHVHHLADMFDALSDVALSRRPTFSTGRVQQVDVAEVITTAAHAAGLSAPRLRMTAGPGVTDIAINAQGLRRVLTNLLENAARHGRQDPVDVFCNRDGDVLVIAVADRGPGIPPESLGELTAKYVGAGGHRGTAGLGLWIVQQISEAMRGRVEFTARDGGGLVATFRAPVG